MTDVVYVLSHSDLCGIKANNSWTDSRILLRVRACVSVC